MLSLLLVLGRKMKNNQNLIWIDLEMTGLEPERDFIIEIATVVTDAHLNILAEGPVFAIHQDDACKYHALCNMHLALAHSY